MSERKRNS